MCYHVAVDHTFTMYTLLAPARPRLYVLAADSTHVHVDYYFPPFVSFAPSCVRVRLNIILRY